MNGAHDVGGMQTFGPVDPRDDGRPFHERWEGRTFAISLILPAQGVYNLNEFRDRRERIPPPAFLAKPYYDLWLTSMEALVEEKAVAGRPAAAADAGLAARMLDTIRHGEPANLPGPAPRFLPGDRVRARDLNPSGHIRMPRYVRGRSGVVDRSHGCFLLPDASAEGRDVPEPLYTVRFEATELWGPRARPGDGVRVDLWESYLQAVDL